MKMFTMQHGFTGILLIAFLLFSGYSRSQSNCIPDSLQATNITAHAADLRWTGINGPTHVRYYVTGTTNYKYMMTRHHHVTLRHLLPNTAYSWDLNNFCNGHWTEYSGNGSFTTLPDTLPPPCVPTDLNDSNATAHSVTLTWAGISGPTHVRYYLTGTTNYKYAMTRTNRITLRHLKADTTYSWDLNNLCEGEWTPYTGNGSFTTLPDTLPPPCVPTDLSDSNATAHSVTLSWAGISGPTHVRYYLAGTTNYKYAVTHNNHITLRHLHANSTYSWDLNNLCEGEWTPYTGNGSFTTLPEQIKLADMYDQVQTSEGITDLISYPNPLSDRTTITFKSNDNDAYTYQLLDVTGKVVKTGSGKASIGVTNLDIDFSGATSGLYFLHLQKGSESKHLKLIKK